MTELRDHAPLACFLLVLGLLFAQLVIDTREAEGGTQMSDWTQLTPEEERVIVHKGTERAFTGEYWNTKEDGTYVCRRCAAPLFNSDAKFDSRSGWPSFDQEVPGAVKRVPDADGRRTEIVCARCEGHLGHVFEGEGFDTPTDERYCINATSLRFVPAT